MARCAVPARVVAGGTNIRATLALEEVAPLHAARTSQRDVPTTLNTYQPAGLGWYDGRFWRSAMRWCRRPAQSTKPEMSKLQGGLKSALLDPVIRLDSFSSRPNFAEAVTLAAV